jgi:uncharacterized protein YkwD
MPRLFFAMMLTALLLVQTGATQADEFDHIRAEALALVNQSRKQQSLPPLTLEAKLTRAAQWHADDMLKRNFFAHASPEGKTVGDRFVRAGGTRWRLIAENIATFTRTPPPVTDGFLKHLHESWMNSPGHRKNILLPGITQFGFGIAVNARGDLYAVQTFAGPGGGGAGAATDGKPIPPQQQVALALAAINAERRKAGSPALGLNDALTKGALAMLPAKGDDKMGLGDKNVLDLVPTVEGQGWATVSVLGAMCGGCGTQPVAADVGFFTGQWIGDQKKRAILLSSELTDLGFAIAADGVGKKVAIGVLGQKEQR